MTNFCCRPPWENPTPTEAEVQASASKQKAEEDRHLRHSFGLCQIIIAPRGSRRRDEAGRVGAYKRPELANICEHDDSEKAEKIRGRNAV